MYKADNENLTFKTQFITPSPKHPNWTVLTVSLVQILGLMIKGRSSFSVMTEVCETPTEVWKHQPWRAPGTS